MKHTLDKIVATKFHRDMLNRLNVGYRTRDEICMAIQKQDNWEMASNIMKITFIIRNHTPHKIDFNYNKYIK